MSLAPLDNLVKTSVLKIEPPDQGEFDGLVRLGTNRLKDAHNEANSPESRFDLAYNAAHSLALAAMRWHGYRPDRQRFVVFQALQHTLGLAPEQWRILDKAHSTRNQAEYEGYAEVDEQLLAEILKVTDIIRKKVAALDPIQQ
ncbi:hypothetical protein [Nitrobacter sp.]|uniref:hypothetical protein n=1 Tax=Nitrobacter sp. TaxID=29420 RepID=UPI001D868DE7|nr:hypothetical protein [Nitrobacter sp.]MCB1394380.1 hypothetical protein [Nitrobacter sp.]